jgi:predicted RNase H-like HicB family nuclease
MTEPAEKSEPVAAEPAAASVKRLPDVPVFNCHVYTSPADADGVLRARVANLPEVTAQGRTQREVLQKIVAAFKTTVQRYLDSGGEIPWTAPPMPRESSEQELWIAVHL